MRIKKRISIHTLHTEGDPEVVFIDHIGLIFQSTPSTRRVTFQMLPGFQNMHISIHTLHTEGDRVARLIKSTIGYFNPHPPHGG